MTPHEDDPHHTCVWDNRSQYSARVLDTLRPLSRKHVEDLRSSGLSDATIKAADLRSVEGEAVARLLNWKGGGEGLGPCLMIPYLDRDGKETGFARVRPDRPLMERENGREKPRKYEQPKGVPLRPYIPPAAWPLIDDATQFLLLTEGEKKCLKAVQEGFACVGLPGVTAWSIPREKPRRLHPELANLPLNGRKVFVVFDSDAVTNESVRHEEQLLSKELQSAGADARIVRLPAGPDGEKVGLDDYLLSYGASGLQRLMETAEAATARTGRRSVRLPWEPFPLDALPPQLRALAEAGGIALGCDPAFIALPALAVCASAIGNSRSVKLNNTWTEPSVLWTAIVGDSGTLKTPAFRLALEPLWEAQERLLEEHKAAMARYQKEREEKSSRGEEPEKPTLRRVICSDITIEKLAEILEDNPRGVLIARDELAGWLGSFERYKGRSGGSDLPGWLELYNAGNLQYDRKTGDRRHILVRHAAASVTGGIQPGVLGRLLSPAFFDSGLVARMLLAMPPRRPKRWSEADLDHDVRDRYAQLIDTLLRLEMRAVAVAGLTVRRLPDRLTITGEAKAVWIDWVNNWGEVQSSAEGRQAAAFSKLEGAAARLALVHHVCTLIDLDARPRMDLMPASVTAGVTLARWFAREARRLYAYLAKSADERELDTLADRLRRCGGSITARDLRRGNDRYQSTDDAEADLERLVEAGLARWEPVPPSPKGGRPTRRCTLVAPRTDETETDETPPPVPGGDAEHCCAAANGVAPHHSGPG